MTTLVPPGVKVHLAPGYGQLVALAQDAQDLADALILSRFSAVGHDWGLVHGACEDGDRR